MNAQHADVAGGSAIVPNGSGAAAILSAGIGSLALALLSIAADKSASLKSLLSIYKPTGALSGVTTAAVALWLILWILLDLRWRKKTVSLSRSNVVAFMLLALSLLLTFPPVRFVLIGLESNYAGIEANIPEFVSPGPAILCKHFD
jgi:hypothetical protein